MARFPLNNPNIRKILRSNETLHYLESKAQRVAQAADRAAHAPGGHKVVSEIGANRARAAVVTETPKAMFKEATVRSLTQALGAARG